jgi:hypothetical protein
MLDIVFIFYLKIYYNLLFVNIEINKYDIKKTLKVEFLCPFFKFENVYKL